MEKNGNLRVEIKTYSLDDLIDKIKTYGEECWKAYRIDASDVAIEIPELAHFSDFQLKIVSKKLGKALDIVRKENIPHYDGNGKRYFKTGEYFVSPELVEKSYGRWYDEKNWKTITHTEE